MKNIKRIDKALKLVTLLEQQGEVPKGSTKKFKEALDKQKIHEEHNIHDC